MKILLSLLIYSILISPLATYDLSALTSASFSDPVDKVLTIKGNANGDSFGDSARNAGDVNGDGISDIIIAASGKGSVNGAVYIIYGKKDIQNLDLSSQDLDPQTTGFTVTGRVASSSFANSVAGAGDVNGDGFADVIIGSFWENNGAGAVYVIYGNTVQNLKNINLATETLDPTKNGFTIIGAAGDTLGYSVSSAGDFNKDGYADIIFGGYNQGSGSGKAYIIYGKSILGNFNLASTSTPLDPTSTGFWVTGESGDHLGSSVDSAGDVNSDGYPDIIIGADNKNSNTGGAYVIYGKKKADLKNLPLAQYPLIPGDTGFKILGGIASGQFGKTVAGVGDINKDGYADVIIAAPNEYGDSGGAYVIYGNKKEELQNLDLGSVTLNPQTNGFHIKGEQGVAGYPGFKVNSAGDLNNDGYKDIICSAFYTSGYRGKAYVIYGKPKANLADVDLSSQALEPTNNGFDIKGINSIDLLGSAVSSGDFNGDGRTEMLIGASGTSSYRGAAYLIFPTRICLDNCVSCSQPSTCALCNKGYEIINFQCSACVKPNAYSFGVACQDCSEGCSKCSSGDTCDSCYPGYTLYESERCISQAHTTAAANSSAAAFDGASLIGTVLSSGSSLPMNFGLVAKILRNIRYLDLSVSYELQSTYYSWKTTSNLLKAPNSWKLKSESKELPYVFSRYALEPVFLINFWRPLLMMLIGLGLFLIFKGLEIVTRGGENSKRTVITRVINTTASNFALTQFYSNLDDAIFFFVLELKSTRFDTGFRNISFGVAFTVTILGIVLVVLHLLTLRKYQRLRQTHMRKKNSKQIQQFLHTFQNISLIFRDFKDQSIFQQTFLLFQIVRAVLANLITTLLYEYFPAQISLLTLLNITMLIYLFRKQPFKEFSDACGQFFCEIILFVANLSLILIATIDNKNDSGKASIEKLSYGIIILNFILLFGGIAFIVLELGKGFYKACKERKATVNAQNKNKATASSLPNIQNMRPPEMIPRHQKNLQSDVSTAAWLQNNTLSETQMTHMNSTIIEPFTGMNFEDQQQYSMNTETETSYYTGIQSSPMKSKSKSLRMRRTNQSSRPLSQLNRVISEQSMTIETGETTNNEEFDNSNVILQPAEMMMTRQRIGRIKMPPGYRRNKSTNLITTDHPSNLIANNVSRFANQTNEVPRYGKYEDYLKRKVNEEVTREMALKALEEEERKRDNKRKQEKLVEFGGI